MTTGLFENDGARTLSISFSPWGRRKLLVQAVKERVLGPLVFCFRLSAPARPASCPCSPSVLAHHTVLKFWASVSHLIFPPPEMSFSIYPHPPRVLTFFMSLLKFHIIRGDFSDHPIQNWPLVLLSLPIPFTLLYASLFFFIAIIIICHFINLCLFIVHLLKTKYKLLEGRTFVSFIHSPSTFIVVSGT